MEGVGVPGWEGRGGVDYVYLHGFPGWGKGGDVQARIRNGLQCLQLGVGQGFYWVAL